MSRRRAIAPFARGPKDKPWAVITRADSHVEIVTEDGSIEGDYGDTIARGGFYGIGKYAVYSLVPARQVVQSLDGRATGNVYKRRSGWGTGIRIGSLDAEFGKVYMLPDPKRAVPPSEAFEIMSQWSRFVREHGAGMGAFGTITDGLFRSTLTEPIPTYFHPEAIDAVYSGRKFVPWYARKKEVRNHVYSDLPSAYPTALRDIPFPVRIGHRKRAPFPTLDGDGWALARVTVPEHDWSPVPFRCGRWVVWGNTDRPEIGVWTFEDLRLTLETGGTVELMETWRVLDAVNPWDAWWRTVEDARLLESDYARNLAKRCVTRLWGSFGSNGTTGVRIYDASGSKVEDVYRDKPIPASAPYVSALCDSRVRNAVWRQALSGNYDVAYWDTDGGLVAEPLPLPFITKRKVEVAQISGPQAYRYKENENSPLWELTMSGERDYVEGMRYFESGRWQTLTPITPGVWVEDDLYVPKVRETWGGPFKRSPHFGGEQ